MNAITFVLIASVLGADDGWVHTNQPNQRPTRYQTQYDGRFNTRLADRSSFSGPEIPQYSHATIYANQQTDDLPDRPRIDTVPFAERSQLGWSNRRGFESVPNTTLPTNRGTNSGSFQPGYSLNNNTANGFNSGLSTTGLGTSGLGNSNLGNTGLNNSTYGNSTYGNSSLGNSTYGNSNLGTYNSGLSQNNNSTSLPLGQGNSFGQTSTYGQTPNYGQNQYGQNQFGSQAGTYGANNAWANNSSNSSNWNTPQSHGMSSNGMLTPPPTTRWSDPSHDMVQVPRNNTYGNSTYGSNAYNGNNSGFPSNNTYNNNSYGMNSAFGNPGNSSAYNNSVNPVPYRNGYDPGISNSYGTPTYNSSTTGTSNYGYGQPPRQNAFPEMSDRYADNSFGNSSTFNRDNRLADSRNANFPPLTNDLNRNRATIPTASITKNGVQPGFTTTFASLLLFASLGGNIYLGWLARDFYWRYRDLAWEARGRSGPTD